MLLLGAQRPGWYSLDSGPEQSDHAICELWATVPRALATVEHGASNVPRLYTLVPGRSHVPREMTLPLKGLSKCRKGVGGTVTVKCGVDVV